MRLIGPRTLQQRLALYLLLPVAVLLLGVGLGGFFYARTALLSQWGEAALLKLQRAAHNVDMRLNRPKLWVGLIGTVSYPNGNDIQKFIVEKLRTMDGVVEVNLEWNQAGAENNADYRDSSSRKPMMMHGHNRGSNHPSESVEVTPPRFSSDGARQTVSVTAQLVDSEGTVVGKLVVVLRFDYLVETVMAPGWWPGHTTFLVDQAGTVMTRSDNAKGRPSGTENVQLAADIRQAIRKNITGTIFAPGFPPSEVIGFYRLQEAPWILVVIAPGAKILAPIIRFRNYYAITGILCILFILVLIRKVAGSAVTAIRQVSEAAEKIARGDFSPALRPRTHDEVGELVTAFNTMTDQLEERMRLKQAMNLAMEVQQNLLPPKSIHINGFDIVGRSLYCDETGGDYYDLLEFTQLGPGRIGIAVGDGAEHGVAAALMMTTVRALLRSRIHQGGSLSQVVGDVNRLLCLDTGDSGNFMTLFLLVLDSQRGSIEWVRAGHDPALVYDPASDTAEKLAGPGVALGVEPTCEYPTQRQKKMSPGEILLLGTDGIWETENPEGERFGKDRFLNVIRQNHNRQAVEILDAVMAALDRFRRGLRPSDDITLVVVKTDPGDGKKELR